MSGTQLRKVAAFVCTNFIRTAQSSSILFLPIQNLSSYPLSTTVSCSGSSYPVPTSIINGSTRRGVHKTLDKTVNFDSFQGSGILEFHPAAAVFCSSPHPPTWSCRRVHGGWGLTMIVVEFSAHVGWPRTHMDDAVRVPSCLSLKTIHPSPLTTRSSPD